jgi:HK97 family phage major capsid protein
MEAKEIVTQINTQFEQMKSVLETRVAEEVKKFGAPLGETKAAIDGFNARIDALEAKLKRPAVAVAGSVEMTEHDEQYRKAFNSYFRKGEKNVSELEMKTLTSDSNPDGGFLLPRNVRAGIVERLQQFSPIRTLASIETIGIGDSLDVPKEGATNFDAGWTSERGTRSETASGTFGLDNVPTFEQYAKPKASQKMLDDSAFDVEAWITRKVDQRFAIIEGTAFVNGNGVTQPEGLMSNADILSVNSGDAATLTADGVINLYHALPEPYAVRSTFLMRRASVGIIRTFKDPATGAYLWQPALQAGNPASILGQPYMEAIDMPAVAGGAFPILFGDFKSGYLIVDRMGVRVLRDPYSSKPFIEFYTTRRVGGQVILAEAFRKQKVSA